MRKTIRKTLASILVITLCFGISGAFADGLHAEGRVESGGVVSDQLVIEMDENVHPDEFWEYTVTAGGIFSSELEVLQAMYHENTITLTVSSFDPNNPVSVTCTTQTPAAGQASGGMTFDLGGASAEPAAGASEEAEAAEPAEVFSIASGEIRIDGIAPLEGFEKNTGEFTYVNDDGETITEEFAWFIYVPEEAAAEALPVVFALHGLGEIGTDGINMTANRLVAAWADPAWQAEHPCIVVAPQCPEAVMESASYIIYHNVMDPYVELLKSLFDDVIETYQPGKVYLTGLSMGSLTAFHFLSAYPDYPFDGCLLMCGGSLETDVSKVTSQKIMLVVDSSDRENRRHHVVNAYNTIMDNGENDITLAYSYMNYGHFVWTYVYDNPFFMEWLFAQ